MCCYIHVSMSAAMRGRMGKERKRAQRGRESNPRPSTNLCLTHGRNSDRKFPFAAAPGWNDKGMKKCKPEIHSLIIPYQCLSPFYSLTKYQADSTVNSATGTAIPQESWGIYQSPYKQDLTGIKSYMAEEAFPADWAWRQFGSSKISRNAAIINSVRCWHKSFENL